VGVVDPEWLAERVFRFWIETPGPDTSKPVNLRDVIQEASIRRPAWLVHDDRGFLCNLDPLVVARGRIASKWGNYDATTVTARSVDGVPADLRERRGEGLRPDAE
jgi:hypothetical protein